MSTKAKQLSDLWLKASILGATWAASEIILGSFLHNLRIPFNGNILTAIGLILMISASYIWKDKGLFWRAGLICALMKTMSPSAVIFGPMIAIFMEALLLEVSVRLLGKNLIGFLVGSALAMSWILVQKIVNFILFYGNNIVEVYTQLMKFAERQLKIQFDLVWLPIMILLVLYILFGLIAVVIGMKIGNRLLQNTDVLDKHFTPASSGYQTQGKQAFPYSLVWLWVNFLGLVGMLFLINMTQLYIWIPSTLVVILIWTLRYKRGLKQLSKPKFWIFFLIITMLTAFVITGIQGEKGDWIKGLLIGLQMNFRAAIVIVGFSVLGQELYNPKIRNFFAKTAFKQLPIALELAFESLPTILHNLPDLKSIFKKPIAVIHTLIKQSEQRFIELKNEPKRSVYILSDDLDTGKTTFLQGLIVKLKSENIALEGFYAAKLFTNDTFSGYDLVHISDGETIPFLRLNLDQNQESIGRFKVVDSTLEIGKEWVNIDRIKDKQLVILDEIGRWEMEDKGWAKVLRDILNSTQVPILLVIRERFVQDIIAYFQIENPTIFSPNHIDIEEFISIIK